ncbi:MAG: hypothetical protein FWD57_08415, partial [Polyangiaceae bacterium]|nr:hypothetical protein [Polyangiaceae bacterium]
GTGSRTRLVVALLLLCMPAAVIVALLPRLVHGLDFGEDRVSIAVFVDGHVPISRNMVITGVRAQRGGAEGRVSTRTSAGLDRGGWSESGRRLIPLVPLDWDRDQPVHVVLETEDTSSSEQALVDRSTKFRGILRDVLWEGLREQDRVHLTEDFGLLLADDVKLIEHRADPRYDLLVFIGGVAMSLSAALAVGVGLLVRSILGRASCNRRGFGDGLRVPAREPAGIRDGN